MGAVMEVFHHRLEAARSRQFGAFSKSNNNTVLLRSGLCELFLWRAMPRLTRGIASLSLSLSSARQRTEEVDCAPPVFCVSYVFPPLEGRWSLRPCNCAVCRHVGPHESTTPIDIHCTAVPPVSTIRQVRLSDFHLVQAWSWVQPHCPGALPCVLHSCFSLNVQTFPSRMSVLKKKIIPGRTDIRAHLAGVRRTSF